MLILSLRAVRLVSYLNTALCVASKCVFVVWGRGKKIAMSTLLFFFFSSKTRYRKVSYTQMCYYEMVASEKWLWLVDFRMLCLLESFISLVSQTALKFLKFRRAFFCKAWTGVAHSHAWCTCLHPHNAWVIKDRGEKRCAFNHSLSLSLFSWKMNHFMHFSHASPVLKWTLLLISYYSPSRTLQCCLWFFL